MPEETNTQEATTPELDLDTIIADAYNEVNATDEDTADNSTDTSTDDDEPEAEDSDATADEEPEEDEAEDDDDGTISPDEKILEALADHPDAQKRLKEQFKGINKLKARFDTGLARVDNLLALERALEDSATAKEVYAALGQKLKEVHSWEETPTTALQSEDFEYESDRVVFERAKAAALQEIEAKYGLGELKKLADQQRAERAQSEWLAANASAIKAQAEKTANWTVTDQQILKAVAEHPNAKPLEALKRAFPDAYAKAMVSASRSKAKLPEMLDSASGRRNSTDEDAMADKVAAELLANL